MYIRAAHSRDFVWGVQVFCSYCAWQYGVESHFLDSSCTGCTSPRQKTAFALSYPATRRARVVRPGSSQTVGLLY
jgi:hypothetical protein